MEPRHFEMIAEVIHSATMPGGIRKYLALDMADVLADTNPLFDRDRFLKACGVDARTLNLCGSRDSDS